VVLASFSPSNLGSVSRSLIFPNFFSSYDHLSVHSVKSQSLFSTYSFDYLEEKLSYLKNELHFYPSYKKVGSEKYCTHNHYNSILYISYQYSVIGQKNNKHKLKVLLIG